MMPIRKVFVRTVWIVDGTYKCLEEIKGDFVPCSTSCILVPLFTVLFKFVLTLSFCIQFEMSAQSSIKGQSKALLINGACYLCIWFIPTLQFPIQDKFYEKFITGGLLSFEWEKSYVTRSQSTSTDLYTSWQRFKWLHKTIHKIGCNYRNILCVFTPSMMTLLIPNKKLPICI